MFALTQIVDTLGTSVSLTLTNIPSTSMVYTSTQLNGGYMCNSFEGYEGSTCNVDTGHPPSVDNDPPHADNHSWLVLLSHIGVMSVITLLRIVL